MDPKAFERSYDFKLDDFQRRAIDLLHHDRSVLVAAPTGSGKTIVAEYALEKARAEGKKFFYTTPMKALSNQKFRDLSRAYSQGEVGLLTGDNSINSEAPLVVMTTEVLRNMIYEKSPLLQGLGIVVLDECHYLHDPYRGAVWEEIIILLPSSVKLVALSATVSNAVELGDWMDSLRGDVKVVVSNDRPVKLQNFYFVGRALMPLFAKNLQRVVLEQLELLKKTRAARDGRRRKRRGVGLAPLRTDVIKELERQDMLPAIYFLFSRAACDDSVSMWLKEGSGLVSREASEGVARFLDEKAAALSPADLDCLNYNEFRSALMAGVSSHHAGALPLFKEAVEELFAGGQLKVVFATETLSLGINMPARTVVIESLSKWAGDKHRPLTPGEYKQLTGRAGRRGIDEVGHAVVLYQDFFSLDQVRSLVTREPSPVVSSFQVSYNMAVNILAEHDLAEARRLTNLSFAQYAADRRVVTLETKLEALEEEFERELDASRCAEGGDANVYRKLERELAGVQRQGASLSKERRQREISEALSRLRAGDVFIASHRGSTRTVAVVKKSQGHRAESGILVVDADGRYRRLHERSLMRPPQVVGSVSVDKIKSPTRKVRRSVGAKMESLGRGAEVDVAPSLTTEEQAVAREASRAKEELEKNPCRDCQHRERCLEAARRVERIGRQMKSAEKERDSGHDLVAKRLDDVVDLLEGFGFMDGENVTPKGAVLRRIYNECDLLLVEAMSQGFLSRLSPAELAALASWFIYESREGESEQSRRSGAGAEYFEGPLGDALEELEIIEVEIKTAEEERDLDLLGSIDIGFGEAAYLWAGGAELEEMLARFPNGSVGDMVRTMKQVIDLLRQIAEISEDPVLVGNLRSATDMLDRGIVGYSSLESIIEKRVGSRPDPTGG